jgi:hypothetical protein
MTAPTGRIRQAALNPPQLARKAIRNPRLFPEIAEGLKSDKPRVKYGCAKALRLISEQHPDRLFPYFDFFVGLLDDENKILQWAGIFVLSHLARADDDDKFAAIFARYFSAIPGPVLITAANVIQGGARIAQAKPHLADRIAAEILKVGSARYRTPECRNVAIGHAILALSAIVRLLRNPAPTMLFVRKQLKSPRPANRKKAEQFLKSYACALATSMQLPSGTAPASGAATRRPRRVAVARAVSLQGVSSRPTPKVAGEGASHSARGGRAPLPLNRYGLAPLR